MDPEQPAAEISKSLRKKLLALLVATFVVDIGMMLPFIAACVFKYMSLQLDSPQKTPLILAITFDGVFFLSLVAYLFAIKMKSIVALTLTWLLVVVSLVARILLVTRPDLSLQKNSIPDYVILACCGVQIVLLIFVTGVWRKVPERKWLKKFDMTQRMTIIEKPDRKNPREGKHTRLRRFSDDRTDIDIKPA